MLFAQTAARADLVTISGSGTWGADAPVSDYSAPGSLWSFSFDVPDPLDANPTSTAFNFQYFLDGSLVNTTLSSVEFFPLEPGGLFDLNFDDGNTLNFYGDQVYTDPGLSLIPGTYAAIIDINSFAGLPNGSGSGTVTIATTVVPEPSSIVSGGLGLLALAFWRLRRSVV
ncbi:PEP-CTERM sorting domain-containing protein [Isosphaeraceae bacterium EP7]